MSETKHEPTLAETLRAWVEADAAYRRAGDDATAALVEVPTLYRHHDTAMAYLRGYDDARAECAAEIEENGALKRRVQELEAAVERWQVAHANAGEGLTLANREQQRCYKRIGELEAQRTERPQPAAVGVVGAVKYAAIRERDGVLSTRAQFTHAMAQVDMQKCRDLHAETYRVVAIVDPDAVVPLTSKEPEAWRDSHRDGLHYSPKLPAYLDGATVTPLYAGMPEPAAEQDMEKHKTVLPHETYRVVAIVDPDAIVPLASTEPVAWRDDTRGSAYSRRVAAADNKTGTVTPLYAGTPEPAREEA